MKMLSRLALSARRGLAVALPAPALADAAGDSVLAEMDAAMNKAQDAHFDYEIVNKEPGKDQRTMAMRVQLKGEKRLTEFTAPADMKGTKVLILSPTQMYVYLPAFGKVRRIASHTKDQGFLGLSLQPGRHGDHRVRPRSTAARSPRATPARRPSSLTPKAGQARPTPRSRSRSPRTTRCPCELKYFNADGKNVKTETRTGYTCEGDVCTPGELKMVDNIKGNWTKLVPKSRKVNEEISDDVFSKRNLGE